MLPFAHGNFSGRRLIVFGCGYVGGEVARRATAAGMKVTALTRNAEKAADLRRSGIDVEIDDLAGDSWHRRMPREADFVLSTVSSGGGGIEGYRHSYVRGMQSILQWVKSADRVGTIVYTSSTSVYPQDGGVVVDETASTEGVGERGSILLEAEQLLRDGKFTVGPLSASRAREENHGLFERYFILRLAGIYGPQRHHLLEQVKSGEIAGHAGHRLNLIHRDDVVAAIWAAFAALREIRDEIFNVADDNAAPKSEVVGWLAAQLELPIPSFTGVPAGGRRAVTPDRVISNAKLKKTLGWHPKYPSFREGYAQILAVRESPT